MLQRQHLRLYLTAGSSLVVIVIALAALSQAAYGSSPANITFKENPTVKDLDGNVVTVVKTSQQVLLHVSAQNAEDGGRQFVLVTEVQNPIGLTTYLTLQSAYIGPKESYVVESSWIPIEAGEHTVRTWAVTSLTGPQLLSLVGSSDIMVVE